MQKIALTQGKYTLVDDEDYEELSKFRWWFDKGYARRREDGRSQSMQRFILEPQPGMVIDHINRDKLDNRRSNLRLVPVSMNAANTDRSDSNSSGYRGVYWYASRNKWRAEICVNNRNLNLGEYADPKLGALAYRVAHIYFFGFEPIGPSSDGRNDITFEGYQYHIGALAARIVSKCDRFQYILTKSRKKHIDAYLDNLVGKASGTQHEPVASP